MTCDNGSQFLSVGVDWITATANQRTNCLAIAERAAKLLKSEVNSGCFKKPWGMSGFNGWKAGQVQLGKRDKEVIVRLSGRMAQLHWRKIYEVANNISRFDIECTTRTAASAGRRISRHWQEAKRCQRKRKRPTTVGLYRCNDNSATLYLGKRTSGRFGRVYDKGRESGEEQFREAVRYELEAKGECANIIAHEVASSRRQMSLIAGYVAGFFSDRGLSLPERWEPEHHSGVARSRSDIDRKLAWFNSSIRGSVSACVSRGKLVEVIEALGMSHLVQPIPNTRVHQTREDKKYVC